MPTKKRKSAARSEPNAKTVELDAKTVHRFESVLRSGLVASGAVMDIDNKSIRRKSYAKVELDPPTVARLSEVLRHGLVASQSVMDIDNDQLDKMTARIKSGGPRSKKAKTSKKAKASKAKK